MLEDWAAKMTFSDKLLSADIKFARLKLHLTARDQIYLPQFAGSALRGGFGHALRKSCCAMQGQDCRVCMLKTSCLYASVFETSFNHVSAGSYKLSDYPRPFIIEPPFFNQNRFQPGESFSCNLMLIGKAIEFLPYFIFAFAEMGRHGIGVDRGRYRIDKITDQFGENDNLIFDGASERFTGSVHAHSLNHFAASDKDNSKIVLTFKTPTRIKSGNHLTKDLNFRLFMQNLFRRLSLLALVCTGDSWGLNYKSLLEKAEAVESTESQLYWYDWKRYSSRQKKAMKLGGFLGRISFKGDLEEFLPFIKAGEYLHVGKACTFGLGKYEIETS